MKECKYCRTMYEDNLAVCPNCGGNKVVSSAERTEDEKLWQKEVANEDRAILAPESQKKIITIFIIAVVVFVLFFVGIASCSANHSSSSNQGNTDSLSQEESNAILEEGLAYYESGEYVDAIECLEQISSESKYYSEAQDIIEKSTQEYKATVIKKIEAYLDSEDYVAAISLAESASAVLEDDDDLVELYQDAVRSNVLASIEAYIQDDDFVTALSIIESGLEELPNDAELQNKYAEVFSEYRDIVCQEAISSAKNYVADNNYPSAISALKNAESKIGTDSEIEALLTQYTDVYVDSVILAAEKAYEPYDADAVSKASEIIEEALAVLPANTTLLSKAQEYEELSPLDLTTMLVNSGTSVFSTMSTATDVYGNTYSNVYYVEKFAFHATDSDGWGWFCYSVADVDFQYSRITGTIIQNEKYKNATTKTKITIKGDDTVIWTGTVTSDNPIIYIDIDVSTYKNIEVRLRGDNAVGSEDDPYHYAYITELLLWK